MTFLRIATIRKHLPHLRTRSEETSPTFAREPIANTIPSVPFVAKPVSLRQSSTGPLQNNPKPQSQLPIATRRNKDLPAIGAFRHVVKPPFYAPSVPTSAFLRFSAITSLPILVPASLITDISESCQCVHQHLEDRVQVPPASTRIPRGASAIDHVSEGSKHIPGSSEFASFHFSTLVKTFPRPEITEVVR